VRKGGTVGCIDVGASKDKVNGGGLDEGPVTAEVFIIGNGLEVHLGRYLNSPDYLLDQH
jgi:hypothetical protein